MVNNRLKNSLFVLLIAIAAIGFFGCGQKQNLPAEKAGQKGSAPAQEAWQADWEAVKQAAQKEGQVVVIANGQPNAWFQALRKEWDKAGFKVSLELSAMESY